jgi:hypothetical protein
VKVLQLGSESSGNRLVYRILLTAKPTLTLAGRSLPHGDEMPNVAALLEQEKPDKILLVWRDSSIQTMRAVYNRHVGSQDEAWAERRAANRMIADVVGDVYVLVYDLLVLNPIAQITNLARWLGVELSVPEPIDDRLAV